MDTISVDLASIGAYGPARATIEGAPLSAEELRATVKYWHASLYMSAAMIYLRDNPLLREKLKPDHVKRRLLGHWGSDPGLSLVYIHLNRLIRKYDLDMIYLAGPGHGAPGVLSNLYLEGSYSDVYPEITDDEDGLRRFFGRFSFPGGIGSHCTPETPGSIHEGGELGYSISHAYGAAFDNPDLIAAVVVGDGEAETGPLATSWHSNKFLDPVRDGAVLPVLHLNGYKINNPTILARIPRDELEALFRGYGYAPCFVEGSDIDSMHQAMAATLEHCIIEIRRIQAAARAAGRAERPRWPMVILRSPKGWTCPREIDGHRVEGFWRAHQVPIADIRQDPRHLGVLEGWLRSYQPEEFFDKEGRVRPSIRALAPAGARRMGTNTHANGGVRRRPLAMPDFREYSVKVGEHGSDQVSSTSELGKFLRDIVRCNPSTFRAFSPDENSSNRLDALYEATGKAWLGAYFPEDVDGTHLAPDGRLMEMLSEHTLEGWLEGYLLTGRHGFFSTYEAFVHVIRFDGESARQMAGKMQCAALAGRYQLAQPAHHLHRLAPGSQRLYPPGPGLPGRCREQKPGRDTHLSAAGCELPAVGRRPLPAQRQLRERYRRRQAAAPAVPGHGGGDQPLHQGRRRVALGQHGHRQRAGPGHG